MHWDTSRWIILIAIVQSYFQCPIMEFRTIQLFNGGLCIFLLCKTYCTKTLSNLCAVYFTTLLEKILEITPVGLTGEVSNIELGARWSCRGRMMSTASTSTAL
mmetsp:Transcript_23508/g.68048  ORF Transcript_23508/g.68048 Transcript_23508/m.68048 type:complete len:103 (-) Transcript_23508:1190-1498(-)